MSVCFKECATIGDHPVLMGTKSPSDLLPSLIIHHSRIRLWAWVHFPSDIYPIPRAQMAETWSPLLIDTFTHGCMKFHQVRACLRKAAMQQYLTDQQTIFPKTAWVLCFKSVATVDSVCVCMRERGGGSLEKCCWMQILV